VPDHAEETVLDGLWRGLRGAAVAKHAAYGLERGERSAAAQVPRGAVQHSACRSVACALPR
jgi:hypothetical protein